MYLLDVFEILLDKIRVLMDKMAFLMENSKPYWKNHLPYWTMCSSIGQSATASNLVGVLATYTYNCIPKKAIRLHTTDRFSDNDYSCLSGIRSTD